MSISGSYEQTFVITLFIQIYYNKLYIRVLPMPALHEIRVKQLSASKPTLNCSHCHVFPPSPLRVSGCSLSTA